MPTPNPSTRREYKGAAAATTLQNSMTNSDTSFVLVSANNWPTGSVGKFVVCINRGQADEEKILCDTQTSKTVACLLANRGFDGTSAQAHGAGATVECVISAFDADEWNQHTNASSDVHGFVGSLAGLQSAWTSWTPTLPGGWTLNAAAYRKVGKTFEFRLRAQYSGTAALSYSSFVTLPVSLSAASTFQAITGYDSAGITSAFLVVNVTPSGLDLHLMNTASPVLYFNGVIEVA